MGPFSAPPAKIEPSWRAGGLIADLLPVTLPDITDVQITCGTIETEAPGVSQTNSPYLISADGADVRVVWRIGIWLPTVYVDTQHGTQQGVLILPIVLRVTSTAPITHADVEIAIWAKVELTAIVIGIGLSHRQ